MGNSLAQTFANLVAPETFNIAQAILDQEEGKQALIWRSEAGARRTLTYGELRREALRLAQALHDVGLRKGDKVVVLMPRRPETYAVYLALLALGAVVLPGSELLMPSDIAYRLKHAEAKGVIAHAALADRAEAALAEWPAARLKVVVDGRRADWLSYDELVAGAAGEWTPVATHRDDLAFLSYTSGTTGYPKGVMHVHGWAYAHWQIAAKTWLCIQPDDVVWATAGPGWAKWVWSPFVATLMSGATGFHYGGRFDAETFLSLIEAEQVNVLCATPTEYRMMAKVDGLDRFSLPSLREAVSAGEPLNREVIDTFRRHFNLTVRDGYGQTENTLLVATRVGMDVRPGSMGLPTVDGAVEIIDEDGKPLPPGQVGDIAVRRDFPALFRGYYKDPERTEAQFRGDWYITGDRAEKDEDGYLWFSGRADDIIISAGYTIGPFEVEDALVKHPLVRECAAVSSPDDVRGAIVKAFVVLKQPELRAELAGDPARREALVRELQEHVKRVTAPYKYPRAIEFVDYLPKTASGKIRRVELREREWKRACPQPERQGR